MSAPVLLTPGPLTTRAEVRAAMDVDLGSWDEDFIALTARVCRRLLPIAGASAPGFACVPVQGSGTFGVEAAVGTLVPRDGRLLVLSNGAYGRRMASIAERASRAVTLLESSEDAAVQVESLERALVADPSISHVGIVHVETTAGVGNPVDALVACVAAHGRRAIVDAMSAFGALPASLDAWDAVDALVGSPNKCLESVPGIAVVIARTAALERAAGRAHTLSLDLEDQWRHMARTGQWRYTPPTHVLAALDAALDVLDAEGGPSARLARYEAQCAALLDGAGRLGLRPLVDARHQAPVIVAFRSPTHPRYAFGAFYAAVKRRGFILYPGKLTQADTFRVGCIGAIEPATLTAAVGAIGEALAELGVPLPLTEPQP